MPACYESTSLPSTVIRTQAYHKLTSLLADREIFDTNGYSYLTSLARLEVIRFDDHLDQETEREAEVHYREIFNALPMLGRLTSLDLGGLDGVGRSPELWPTLARLTQLRQLSLNHIQVDLESPTLNDNMAYLTALTNLELLVLPEKVPLESWRCLSVLTSLKCVVVNSSQEVLTQSNYEAAVEYLSILEANAFTRIVFNRNNWIQRPINSVVLNMSDSFRHQELLSWEDIWALVCSENRIEPDQCKLLFDRFPTIFKQSYLNAPDLSGKTAAQTLCEQGGSDAIRYLHLLASRGANLAICTQAGTLLHCACSNDVLQWVITQVNADRQFVNLLNKEGETALFKMVEEDTNGVETLIKAGVDVNVANRKKLTALHNAVQAKRTSVINLLLANGADVNARTARGESVLNMALNGRHQGTIRTVLDAKPEVNVADTEGWTPLLLASDSGELETITRIVEAGADINYQLPSQAGENQGVSALYKASWTGNVAVCKYLLSKGANVNAARVNGTTPIFVAAQEGRKRLVKLLLQHGARIDIISKESGYSPIHLAAGRGHTPIVEMFLEHGSIPIDYVGSSGSTPLGFASGNNRVELMKFLLQAGACINGKKYWPVQLNATRQQKKKARAQKKSQSAFRPPLVAAVQSNCFEAVKLLLDKGADINLARLGGQTPLHLSCGNPKIAELLIAAGASVNAVDEKKRTPLHAAVVAKQASVLELLLAQTQGATINSKNHKGHTPLHTCCISEWLEGIPILLKAGAKVNAKVSKGLPNAGATPLYFAAIEGCVKIVEALLNAGADPNIPKQNGASPLYVACEWGSLETVKLLLGRGADPTLRCSTCDYDPPIIRSVANNHPDILAALVEHGCLVNAVNTIPHSPLTTAVSLSHVGMARYLLANKASVTEQTHQGMVPLHHAIFPKNLEILQMLADYPQSPIEARTQNGFSPLAVAAQEGWVAGLEALMARGANPNSLENDSRTVLHVAVAFGQLAAVEFLLTKGRDPALFKHPLEKVDTVNKWNATPLTSACELGLEHIVSALISAGANVNVSPDWKHQLPLTVALQYRRWSCARILIQHGANVNYEAFDKTPLCMAAQHGFEPIVKQLLEAGAKVNPWPWYSCKLTPLLYGAQHESPKIVEMLVQQGADLWSRDPDGRTALFFACREKADLTAQFLRSKGLAWRRVPTFKLAIMAVVSVGIAICILWFLRVVLDEITAPVISSRASPPISRIASLDRWYFSSPANMPSEVQL